MTSRDRVELAGDFFLPRVYPVRHYVLPADPYIAHDIRRCAESQHCGKRLRRPAGQRVMLQVDADEVGQRSPFERAR
jgi:hypothetical protein